MAWMATPERYKYFKLKLYFVNLFAVIKDFAIQKQKIYNCIKDALSCFESEGDGNL
jgi:hypothetical protein